MYILGINAFHAGSSACLIEDGKLIGAVEEERFQRLKYWAGFPVESIRWCVDKAGIRPQEIDHIGISRDPSAHLYRKIQFALKKRPSLALIKERLANMSEVRDTRRLFCDAIGIPESDITAQFHNVEHHRAHMASAFFVSPFQDAAIVSLDGFGDFVSTMTGEGSGTRIESLDSVYYPHSLGIFFTAVTQWLGFPKFGDEGKIQGLAAFGQPAYLDDLRRILRLQAGGSFELDLDYFVHWAEGVDMTWHGGSPVLGTVFSRKFVDRFGPQRVPGTGIATEHANMAASVQAMLEEAEFHVVRHLQRKTGKKALCMAGGVALNSTFNGKVIPETEFQDIFIQPAANDAGTALGVAYYIYHHILGRPRCFTMEHAYTGPSFTSGAIENALSAHGFRCKSYDDEGLARACAELVANGSVLGWFQGNMEWGPRALGNRSILADPRRADMKDTLNARIKHREAFRPFAPAVLLSHVSDYFDQSYPDPFMVKVYNVLDDKRRTIPAVTHVDGTGRLQTVEQKANPLYWQLIKEFQNVTGVPVLLNTSFNENEPIVCRPEEAIQCFLRTKMDALAIGNFVIQKQNTACTNRLHTFSGGEAPAQQECQTVEAISVATCSPTGAQIAPMEADDLPSVVELHMAHLTERLSGVSGRDLLTEYYRLLCSCDYGLCLVARNGSHRINGFVALHWDAFPMGLVLAKSRPIVISRLLTSQIVQAPASAWPLARSLWERKPVRRALRVAGDPNPWCMLHALVTNPTGNGVGRSLVEAALAHARHRGFKYLITSTYQTVGPANHLYKNAGFVPLLITADKRHKVNWYGRSI